MATRNLQAEPQAMPVEEYLRGWVGFVVDDSAIATILVDRGILPGTPVSELDKKQKDLCKADLYMWCASTPSTTGSIEEADGDWRHKVGSTQSSAYDKRNLRAMAKEIYDKYGEGTTQAGIKLYAYGMKVWRNKR